MREGRGENEWEKRREWLLSFLLAQTAFAKLSDSSLTGIPYVWFTARHFTSSYMKWTRGEKRKWHKTPTRKMKIQCLWNATANVCRWLIISLSIRLRCITRDTVTWVLGCCGSRSARKVRQPCHPVLDTDNSYTDFRKGWTQPATKICKYWNRRWQTSETL